YENSDTHQVFMQRVASNGVLSGAAALVSNNAGVALTGRPQVAVLANGNFVVTWEDDSHVLPDASGLAIHAQLFNANAAEIGSEIVVNTAIASNQDLPAVVASPNGGYAITWSDATTNGVQGQLFDAFGNRVGTEFNISSGSGEFAAIAALS